MHHLRDWLKYLKKLQSFRYYRLIFKIHLYSLFHKMYIIDFPMIFLFAQFYEIWILFSNDCRRLWLIKRLNNFALNSLSQLSGHYQDHHRHDNNNAKANQRNIFI